MAELRRPSPAMVVAMVALFLALGGSAAALRGQNTVRSDDIKNGQVKDRDLGPDALDDEFAAAVASSDAKLAVAVAEQDGKLAGQGPFDVAPTSVDGPGDESACDSGQTGEFCGGWHSNSQTVAAWGNYGGETAPAQYFKDASGTVHLSGAIRLSFPADPGAYFILPEGFRPAAVHYFTASCFYPLTSKRYRIAIGPDGRVEHSGFDDDLNCDYRPLGGISFYAG